VINARRMVDLARELEALQPSEAPAGRAVPSDLRLNIRDNFDAITAARGRGVSWATIAVAMTRAGVRGPGGVDVGWRALKSLFHAERYERERKAEGQEGKPKWRTGKDKRARQGKPATLGPLVITPEPPAPPESAAAPAPKPQKPAPQPPAPPSASEGPFATGDPALDRALNSVRKLTPLPPMGTMSTQGRRNAKPKGDSGDGEDG
jgi:hypothetical protein